MSDTRIFPHALEMERALLGAAILAPAIIDDARDVMQPTDLYRPDHVQLWLLLLLMRAAGDHIDLMSVAERVRRSGDDEKHGGYAYIIDLVTVAPSTVSGAYYASQIAEKARKRRLIAALQAAAAEAYEEARSTDEITAGLATVLDGVVSGGSVADDWQDWGELVPAALGRVRDAVEGKPLPGYPMPLRALAAIVERIQPGDLIVIAARPAMGKTSLAMVIAKWVAGCGDIVGVFSLEMSGDQLAMGDLARTSRRVIAGDRGLPIGALEGFTSRDLAAGRIGDSSWHHLETATEIAAALPIRVSRKRSVTIADIESDVRKVCRLARAKGRQVGAIVIDYLQLITLKGKVQNKADAIGDITRALKNLAGAQGVVIILLSQLNRNCEGRDDKRPRVPDLRDSGTIEQDADVIIFCYRDHVYTPDASPHDAELIVAKQRNGLTGTAHVKWSGPSTEFYDDAEETFRITGYDEYMKTGGL